MAEYQLPTEAAAGFVDGYITARDGRLDRRSVGDIRISGGSTEHYQPTVLPVWPRSFRGASRIRPCRSRLYGSMGSPIYSAVGDSKSVISVASRYKGPTFSVRSLDNPWREQARSPVLGRETQWPNAPSRYRHLPGLRFGFDYEHQLQACKAQRVRK